MLNMKKGLALVLAAATAFTFAPVSTLGLTGVVDAEAAFNETTKTYSEADANGVIDSTGTFVKDKPAIFGLTKTGTYIVLIDGKLQQPDDVTRINGGITQQEKPNSDNFSSDKEEKTPSYIGMTANDTGYADWSELTTTSETAHSYQVIKVKDDASVSNKTTIDADESPLNKLMIAAIYPDAVTEAQKAAANSADLEDVAVAAAESGLNLTSADPETQGSLDKAVSDNAQEIQDYIEKQVADQENTLKNASDADKEAAQTKLEELKAQQEKINKITSDAKEAYTANTAVEKHSDTFGGVSTDILITDGYSYSLVNDNATFKLSGDDNTYTADQLTWYLTKQVQTHPKNIVFTSNAGETTTGVGKLQINVKNAKQFKTELEGAHIVGVYESAAQNKVIYNAELHVTAMRSGVETKHYDAAVVPTNKDTANSKTSASDPLSSDFLDSVQLIGVNNKLLTHKDSEVLTSINDADNNAHTITDGKIAGSNFTAELKNGAADSDNTAKGSLLYTNSSDQIKQNGVYYETYYIPYQDKNETDAYFIAEVTVTVSVNAGPTVEVKDGDFTYSSKTDTPDDTKVIDLDLSSNKTFDIAAHSYSDIDGTTYDYQRDTENITVDNKGVVTAAKVGTATVTITPSAKGVKENKVYLFFRVTQNSHDTITVTGKDGDKATVLSTREFNANNSRNTNPLNTEENLAKAQVGYVQIEVTGDETTDVKEDLTVKGSGKLSYSLAGSAKLDNDNTDDVSVDSKTGTITVSHDFLNKNFKTPGTTSKPYVFPVKVVSTETNTSALTTAYFYVVIDYADANITGLENNYEVGASVDSTDSDSWLNLGKVDLYSSVNNRNTYVPTPVSSNADITASELDNSDDLDDSKLYDADNTKAFDNDFTSNAKCPVIKRAFSTGKTEHILVTASDAQHKIGQTYRVVTVKSVAGQTNYVTKIENVDNGKTIYEQGAGVNSGASITINKPTVVKVTVAHTPATTLNAKDDPAFTLGQGGDQFNYNTNNLFVAATENPKTYEVTLIPSAEGTQLIKIYPTEGRLSVSDYSLVDTDSFNLAVKYSTADSKTPAQVKGVKLGNKKGAKVVVKFTKDTTDKNIKYYVQKKVGKKTSGKSIGSNRTILSVAKGKTVKVRVKAYYYDANGTKHVGKYSKWVTKKTDKK